MTRLSLALLGHPQVRLDEEPATGFESNKARALLAYLAVEADRPHARAALAGLLWPEFPEHSALVSLRSALSNLRQVIGDRSAQPPFLIITNTTLQFNTASDYALDVRAFMQTATTDDPERLRQATSLYRGRFLEGFSIPDSAVFEEWVVLKREQLDRQMLKTLRRLADHYEAQGEYEQAQRYAWQQVELEPWFEEGHQQLMRLLALGGQRSAALAQYETCRRLLAAELGVEPVAQTTALYESIRDGALSAPAGAALPAFISRETQPSEREQPLCVARAAEFARLNHFLAKAFSGHGQVAFVTGEPGRGKTLLMQAFAWRAQSAHPDLVVASGRCNAYTGIGDPYLPFLEILEMLSGDVEARWAGGALARQHAQRLWALLPEAVKALLDHGQELIDRFVPGDALLTRARAASETQAARLEAWLKAKASAGGERNLQQSVLFEQYARMLGALASRHPLMLVVDDLQWADAGSISLLFHLGRSLANQRILLVGAFRPGDIASGPGGERHPLEPVVNEFQRIYGDIRVDLAQSDGRQFVEALLDSEPNRLEADFRQTLYRHTSGHPLFTVELLRGLQERGDLTKDESGYWVAGGRLDWERLPARVEAVIAERFGRLPAGLQTLLTAASVEGEDFTTQALSRVLGADEQALIRDLSGPLSQQYRWVSAAGIQRVDGKRISRYRFRHFLFQKYLYSRLDAVEKAYLHEAVGQALEALYGQKSSEIAVQLARHYEIAGMVPQAVGYLLQAGNKSDRLSAYPESLAHYRKGLQLLETLPETAPRAQQELALQISLGVPLTATMGYSSPEMGRAYARARELCHQLGMTPQLVPVLFGLAGYYSLRADYRASLELSEEIMAIAQSSDEPTLQAVAHWQMGYHLTAVGRFTASRPHLLQALALYRPETHSPLVSVYYQDLGVSCLSWLSWSMWALGYPDQAMRHSREALALAQALAHPFSLAFAHGVAAVFHFYRREVQAAQAQAEAAISVSTKWGFPFFLADGRTWRGWALVQRGKLDAGLAEMRAGVRLVRATGAKFPLIGDLVAFTETLIQTGQLDEAAAVLDEAWTEEHNGIGEFHFPELYRLKGEILRKQGDQAGAESCFWSAMQAAQRIDARSWELRAAVSLCRLWQRQGKPDAARDLLRPIYSWFTEGFATPDLTAAAGLLDELAEQ